MPVVRDWPIFAPYGGARVLFPASWVVDTPEQAAAAVLRATADEETWRRAGQEASELALTSFDWSAVRPGFDRLLLGDPNRNPASAGPPETLVTPATRPEEDS